jgi:hypothetical protein
MILLVNGRASAAQGTVLIVPLDDLPDWLPGWCSDHLGGGPADALFRRQQISMVFGLRLTGGRDVVVKARADDGRARPCVAAQAWLAGRGFPCARPLTPVVRIGGLAVHAEEFRPGGEVLYGDSPDVAVRYAQVFGWLMAELAGVTAYQDLRERSFTAAEQEVAWAASLWTAAYNAREEALHGRTAVSGDALRAQAAEGLRRAGT